MDFLSPTIGETAPKSLSLDFLSLGHAFALVDKALIFFVPVVHWRTLSEADAETTMHLV